MIELTKTSGPDNGDAAMDARLMVVPPTIDTTTVEMLGDSAYATGDILATLDRKGWTPLLKPWPIKPAVPGGFTIDDSIHDPSAGTLPCPAEVTRTLTKARRAVSKHACHGCPLRNQCTTSATGRSVVLHEHDTLQGEHRQRADEDFQATYRQHRPMAERIIA
jgi:hypothetical protein